MKNGYEIISLSEKDADRASGAGCPSGSGCPSGLLCFSGLGCDGGSSDYVCDAGSSDCMCYFDVGCNPICGSERSGPVRK